MRVDEAAFDDIMEGKGFIELVDGIEEDIVTVGIRLDDEGFDPLLLRVPTSSDVVRRDTGASFIREAKVS